MQVMSASTQSIKTSTAPSTGILRITEFKGAFCLFQCRAANQMTALGPVLILLGKFFCCCLCWHWVLMAGCKLLWLKETFSKLPNLLPPLNWLLPASLTSSQLVSLISGMVLGQASPNTIVVTGHCSEPSCLNWFYQLPPSHSSWSEQTRSMWQHPGLFWFIHHR